MNPVIVTAIFHPADNQREELMTRLSAAIPDVHAENGCLLYALHDAVDGTIILIEKWENIQSLEAHGAGAAVLHLNTTIKDLLTQPAVVTRMTSVPAGETDQGTL